MLLQAICAEVHAQQRGKAPPVRANLYSRYEQRAIDEGLSRLGGELDPQPEGKTIESIEVVSLEVIEPRDPVPLILNSAHAKTRDYVIAREVLLKVGEPWRQVLVNETARNLRALPQLSLVVCQPLVGSAPDKVRLAVITKDVWSLRISWDLAYTPGGFEKLVIAPIETNLLGLHQTVGTRAEIQPESVSLGARYNVPRLFGTRVSTNLEANVIFNRHTGAPEGSYGFVNAGQKLFSTQTKWSWDVDLSWRDEITRRYVNGKVGTFDAGATPYDDALPFQYRSSTRSGWVSGTRSFGWGIKHDFTLGVEGAYKAFSLADVGEHAPAALDEFQRTKVPVTDHRLNPFVQYSTYSTDFMTVLDLDTLGLQEDVRLGHGVYARVYPVTRALGSSRDYLGLQIGAGYVVPLGDGFGSLGVSWTQEAASDAIADASLSANLQVATPRTPLGRVILYTNTLVRYRNYQNQTSFLGGDSSLRGYPSHYFVGQDLFIYNLEFRSRPIEVLTSQLSLAVFHDVGDAFDSFDTLYARQAVGFGLRALLPQVSRMIMRLDVGFPLTRQDLPDVAATSFFLSYGQAFPAE